MLVPAIVVIGLGVVFFKLKNLYKNPDDVLKLSRFLNKLDNQTDFNTNKNSYLVDEPFVPSNQESVGVEAIVVHGSIPDNFTGMFVYNGPNPELKYQISHGYNWFDGHGMLKSLRFQDGKAFYFDQWINTTNYALMNQYQQVVFPTMGDLLGLVGIFRLFYLKPTVGKAFNIIDCESYTANTAFFIHQDKLYATHEASYPYRIQFTPDGQLLSLGYETFNQTLNYPFPAHVKRDPIDGKDYFCGYAPMDACSTDKTTAADNNAAYKCGILDQGKVIDYFPVHVEKPASPSWPFMYLAGLGNEKKPYLHDYCITEHYIVLIEMSILFILNGYTLYTGDYYRYKKDSYFRIGLVNKTASTSSSNSSHAVQWFQFDTSIALYHTVNAYEDEKTGEVVIFTPAANDFHGLDPKKPPTVNPYYLAEIRVNPSQPDYRYYQNISTEYAVEFPHIHPDYLGRKCQYAYMGLFNSTGTEPGFYGIGMVDLITREFVEMIHYPSHIVSYEPLVIPKNSTGAAGAVSAATEGTGSSDSDSDGSDDVYIATFGFDFIKRVGIWMLFDGQRETMSNETLLTLELTGGLQVPEGFHAIWLSEQFIQEMNK